MTFDIQLNLLVNLRVMEVKIDEFKGSTYHWRR